MIAQAPCDRCNGGGVAGVVSKDMALDAQEPSMEGLVITCNQCGGAGWIEFEVEDEP